MIFFFPSIIYMFNFYLKKNIPETEYNFQNSCCCNPQNETSLRSYVSLICLKKETSPLFITDNSIFVTTK